MKQYGIYEIVGNARKVRVGEKAYVSIEAALLDFDKVIDWEFSDDGEACDLAADMNGSLMIYAIEAVAA